MMEVAKFVICEENILFWEVYTDLQKCSESEDRLACAEAMLAKYLISDAPYEVNIESSTRCSMERRYAILQRNLDRDIDLKVFDPAVDEVMKMIHLNMWPKYKEMKLSGLLEEKKTKGFKKNKKKNDSMVKD